MPFKQIDRYLAKLILVPLVGTLCLAAMLLIMDRMLRLFDFVVSEGGPVTVVWRMLANLIPEYLGLAVPVGLTLGVLLAFRKLALSSELDTLRAVGLGYGRLLRVPYVYGVALLVATFCIVGFLQPKAQYAYQQLRFELSSGALGASIKVGEFTRLGRGMTMRVERSEHHGTELYGGFLRIASHNRRRGRSRHLPRHRRSRGHPVPPDQRPAGQQPARLPGAARAEFPAARSPD